MYGVRLCRAWEQFKSFDPRNGDKTSNGVQTELCIQRTDYLQTEPLSVHGHSEVAEVDGVVRLDPLTPRGGGAPSPSPHLLAAAHIWHLRRTGLTSEGVSAPVSLGRQTDLFDHPH